MRSADRTSIGTASALAIALCLLMPTMFAATPVQDIFPTIEFESVLGAGKPVPLTWVEIMIFARNPVNLDFFERPLFDESWPRQFNSATNRQEPVSQFPVRLSPSAFPSAKFWLLYRIGDRAEEQATFESPVLRALFEQLRNKAWVFEIPLSSAISKISINADQLTCTLNDPSSKRRVVGVSFPADYFAYKSRKGGEAFQRLDRLAGAQEFLQSLNEGLPPTFKLNLENTRDWSGEIGLYRARNNGPNGKDRLVMQKGYTPIFVVVRGSSDDVDLPQDRPWIVAPKTSRKEIFTNLSQEDPSVWASIPSDVKTRYENPSRIKAGSETKLIAFWKASESNNSFPDILFIYGRLTTGEELKTVVFQLAPAAAR